jgi:DNA-binding FrmR family transcriptional regulator
MPALKPGGDCPHCHAEAEATHPDHRSQLNALARIEGQVRGVRRMVEEGRYCVDILVQTRAVHAALQRVEHRILKRHLEICVRETFEHADGAARDAKIDEILALFGCDAAAPQGD